MTNATSFPELKNLVGSYFHQDYDLGGGSDEEILASYMRSKPPMRIRAVVAEIDTLLSTPSKGLLDRFEAETGPWDVILAESDGSAREWLLMARRVLLE